MSLAIGLKLPETWVDSEKGRQGSDSERTDGPGAHCIYKGYSISVCNAILTVG